MAAGRAIRTQSQTTAAWATQGMALPVCFLLPPRLRPLCRSQVLLGVAPRLRLARRCRLCKLAAPLMLCAAGAVLVAIGVLLPQRLIIRQAVHLLAELSPVNIRAEVHEHVAEIATARTLAVIGVPGHGTEPAVEAVAVLREGDDRDIGRGIRQRFDDVAVHQLTHDGHLDHLRSRLRGRPSKRLLPWCRRRQTCRAMLRRTRHNTWRTTSHYFCRRLCSTTLAKCGTQAEGMAALHLHVGDKLLQGGRINCAKLLQRIPTLLIENCCVRVELVKPEELSHRGRLDPLLRLHDDSAGEVYSEVYRYTGLLQVYIRLTYRRGPCGQYTDIQQYTAVYMYTSVYRYTSVYSIQRYTLPLCFEHV